MTSGSIQKKIILFALPVFLGNLFQQLYNVADSLVVGNVLGREALAAVSSSGNLIFLMIGFIQGIFMGAGIIISRHYGAKEYDKVHATVHTTVAFGLLAGVFLTVAGMLLTPQLLKLMGTPSDVLPNSITYFRLYFAGSLASVMYNTTTCIFQSVGDSRHPLYFLITASVLNVLLDLLFVKVLGFGIAGAALATVISQFTSAVLSFTKLLRIDGYNRICIKEIRLDLSILKRVLQMGIPTGIQNSVIGFANVLVQSNINTFGSFAMAGCGSYSKLEGFVFLPITSFCAALTTFVSQNLGAKEYTRVRKGARFGVISGILLAMTVGAILYAFAPFFVSRFNDDPEVVGYGVLQVRTESIFYGLLAASHCLASIIRGSGKTTVSMATMLVCWCVIRIIYITVFIKIYPSIQTIFFAYPITWTLSTIIFVIYYFKSDWIHNYERKRTL